MDYYLKTSKNINKDQKNPDLSLSIESTCPSKERERERERERDRERRKCFIVKLTAYGFPPYPIYNLTSAKPIK